MSRPSSKPFSIIRGVFHGRTVMTLTLAGATVMFLGGCAGGQGLGSTVSYSVVGLWLGGASLLGLLTGCGSAGGSGGGALLSKSAPVTTTEALHFVSAPAATQALAVLTPAPQVEVLDSKGNRDTSFTGPITVALGTAPQGAVLTGTTTVNAVAGVATFSNLKLSVGGTYTLQASSGSLQAGISSVVAASGFAPSFAGPVNYPVGGSPGSIAQGDFNGDGKTDLVVAGNGTVSILLGNGDGTFQAHVATAVASAVRVVVGDLNGDGKADLAVANGNGGVYVLLGKGDGSFQAPVNYAAGKASVGVALTDLNGDGKVDLVVANANSNDVSVLLGKGDGTFQTSVPYSIGSNPRRVSTGDVNGDGKPDIVATNTADSTVSVLLGKGNGTFQTQVSYAVGSQPQAVALADVNGDGKLDILSNMVLLGKGDGTFQPCGTPTVFVYGGLAVADVNADGKLDVVNSNGSTTTFSVMLGQGDGSFKTSSNLTAGDHERDVLTADLNGDGKLDFVTVNYYDNNISVLLSQ